MSKSKDQITRIEEIYTPHTGYVTLLVKPKDQVSKGTALFQIDRLGVIDTIDSSVDGRVIELNTSLIGRLNEYNEHVLSIEYEANPEYEKMQKELEKSLKLIYAPFTAAYYLSASPGEQFMVNEGDNIIKGQLIAKAMVMKQKRDVCSDLAGIVRKVYFNNGDVVPEEENLFGIEEIKD